LRPGISGISEHIRVHTVIDRFLEHARIFHFKNGGADEVFCSSADWMPRNFRRRVEVMFPVLDEGLKQRMIDEVLGNMRADTNKGWLLKANGQYERLPDRDGIRSQQRFMDLARERARGEQDALRGLASKPLTMPPPPIERLRHRADKKRKKRRRED
jgi:polyphosphate kinase